MKKLFFANLEHGLKLIGQQKKWIGKKKKKKPKQSFNECKPSHIQNVYGSDTNVGPSYTPVPPAPPPAPPPTPALAKRAS